MNLIVDIGNTRVKIAVFEGQKMVHKDAVATFDRSAVTNLKNKFPQLSHAIVSSVAAETEEIERLLSCLKGTVLSLSQNTPLPITNGYKTPTTLGLDRLAAAMGAYAHGPNSPSLIIDMGTAITVDFLTEENEFKGGNISPGVHTRFKALHKFTQRLPHISPTENWPIIGTDTTSAIEAGVQNGVLFELEGYINSFNVNYKSLTVFLTGGEAFFFAKKLKNIIFAPNLLAEGLNHILNYNLNVTQ